MSPSNNPQDEPFGSIMAIAQETQRLAQLALLQYTPVVDAIIRNDSKDIRHIEHTLDHLLDFGFSEPMVELFRKLCRHYYFIDAGAVANYVLTYRKLWDSEDPEKPPSTVVNMQF